MLPCFPAPRACRSLVATAVLLAWGAVGLAQTAEPDGGGAGALAPVVITGDGAWQQRWLAPGSIEVVDGDELRAGQLQINLSEGLGRVPGLVVRNRQNYAQDLQISVRGFGARAPFGVRGVRLYVDGIPASAPDGQGQAANFPIGSADRIEVIRGPFSALYGASAGGVIALYTQDGQRPAEWRSGLAAGSNGLWRFSTQLTGQTGSAAQPGWSYSLDVGQFATDGERAQSAASRATGNLKLSRAHEGGRTVLLLNRQTSRALDPLGLTRAEFDADPGQTTPVATQFNTRKTVSQTQLGLAWEQALGQGHRIELMGYGGQRRVRQFQAIPTGAQIPAGSAGGVIDLARDYWGWNARWRLDRHYDSGEHLTVSAGLASDRQTEERRGYENFIGPTLGVLGRLRRDETNRASTLDPYVQAEWRTPDTTLTAGLRHSSVRFTSADRYVVGTNPDDSGAVR
ncbi:MAG: TonB-dependent receptor plug domain-containing protein, partial [Hydrogenophaga sp.]|nr:TonB-dependent receptor plug domain-containing protein [Hydrogenophaga sp.]